MQRERTFANLFLTFVALVFVCLPGQAKSAPERWDGVVTFGALKVPFSMQIDFEDDTAVSAVFTSGDQPVKSTGGTLTGDAVRIQFASLGTVLEGVLNGGSMKGTFTKTAEPQTKLPIELNRFCTCGFVGEAGPDISGVWSLKGVEGGRLTVERKGDDTFATIQLTGDRRQFGTLSGRFDGLSFTLSHFAGSKAALLDAEPRKDGTLALNFQLPGEAPRKVVAARLAQ